MLTGCRVGEVLTLKWSDIDRKSGEFRLRDAKTGARMVPLTPTALQVLAGIKRVRRSPWVFPGKRRDRHLSDLRPYWHRVREQAEVEDVRIHDLRHSFASRALALGLALPMIGRLLGHTDIGSTARYAHLSREAEKIAVARVGDTSGEDIYRYTGTWGGTFYNHMANDPMTENIDESTRAPGSVAGTFGVGRANDATTMDIDETESYVGAFGAHCAGSNCNPHD